MRLSLCAAVLLSVAPACGDDAAVRPDAVIGIDATLPIDAAPEPITLTVTRNGSPLAGITTYFQMSATQMVVGEVTTDATGTASVLMSTSAFVTALVPRPAEPAFAGVTAAPSDDLVTFAGAQPGDHLVYDATSAGAPVEQPVTVTAALATGAQSYKLFTTCGIVGIGLAVGSGVASQTVSLPGDCTTADVDVWALDGAGAVVAIAYQPAVTIAATIDLRTTAYVAPTAFALGFTDVPSNVSAIYGNQVLLTANGTLYGPESLMALTSGGMGVATLHEPVVTGARALDISEPNVTGTIYDLQSIASIGPAASTFSLDVAANMVHEYSSEPAFAAATHSAAWTESAAGSDADFRVTELETTRGDSTWSWQLASPQAGPTVVFPTLPTDVFDFNAAATDTTALGDLTSYKVPGGYAAVRAHVFNLAATTELGTGTTATEQDLLHVGTLRAGHRPHRLLR